MKRRKRPPYKAGEQSAGICDNCRAVVMTTFVWRRATPEWLEWANAKVVLVSVCNRCEAVVGIPHQSTKGYNRK